MRRRILMVAYHFPPILGSSGVQRTLNFARHLPAHGWDPLVLTVAPRAYPQVDSSSLSDPTLPPYIGAFCLDASRHLAIARRYPNWLAWPDRWSSWWLGAVPLSWRKVRAFEPDLVWSTYPIATAHLIGRWWARHLKRPWVVELRDPMSEDNYQDPRAGKIVRNIERSAVHEARQLVVTTPGIVRELRERYPNVPDDRFNVIPNGYDEQAFVRAEKLAAERGRPDNRLRLVHSGILYPQERDPRPFLRAVADLARRGLMSEQRVQIVLRATGHDEVYEPLIREWGLGSLVQLAPARPYVEALAELVTSDGLLLFQGSICNNQIPAKAYEYMRAARPIIALADAKGDTAALLARHDLAHICPPDDVEAITALLTRFLESNAFRTQNQSNTRARALDDFSREAQCHKLARVLDAVVAAT